DCLKSVSAAAGWDVRFLSAAGEVLRGWSNNSPDVCLVNVWLDDMTGFDLVEMLRPFPTGQSVGIVTDHYVVEDEVRALELGVHRYFCKPLEGAVLWEFCTRRNPERRCCH